jgi:hypothetical protein
VSIKSKTNKKHQKQQQQQQQNTRFTRACLRDVTAHVVFGGLVRPPSIFLHPVSLPEYQAVTTRDRARRPARPSTPSGHIYITLLGYY